MSAILRQIYLKQEAFRFTSATLGPLAKNEGAYIRRVLVTEVAVRLIMEDRGCSQGEANEVLVESREFGAAVWGADDEEEDLLAGVQQTQLLRHSPNASDEEDSDDSDIVVRKR